MNKETLELLLQRIRKVRIGVAGDFCLDVYLTIDMGGSETSVETGLATRPVREQRCSLGGAGNVVNNLVAIGVKEVATFGVVGDDPYGWEMRRILQSLGVEVSGLLTQRQEWQTSTYTKLYDGEREDRRIDYGNFNRLSAGTQEHLLQLLDQSLPELDILIVNQQLLQGIHTEEVRQGLNELIARHPDIPFIVDSRQYSDAYPHAMHKLNDREGARLCGRPAAGPAGSQDVGFQEARVIAGELYRRWGSPVFLTRGEFGCLVYDQGGCHEIPGLQILAPIDTVGAGDSMLAGIAAALSAGEDPLAAAELGNLVAGVTVQKLRQTGTACPEEILAIGRDPDYRYHPQIAFQPHKGRYVEDTEIEIVSELPKNLDLRHAIFDHDGTISTLRQGWEEVMEPMMVRAMLGKRFNTSDEGLRQRVTSRAREYIEKTTGVQTLVQMKGLAGMVREFGLVSEDEVLDEHGYKAIYNRALMNGVERRMAKLRRGEIDLPDCTIKSAVPFLKQLHSRAILLYLASGTDQADVEREAEELGYADLFRGRIYGAVGDIGKEPKKMVLERILKNIGEKNYRQIITFGDGPVEIRETHKRGALAVGVASDEVRRFGLSQVKRARLIQAGADLIVPDFSQMHHLFRLLFP